MVHFLRAKTFQPFIIQKKGHGVFLSCLYDFKSQNIGL